MGRIKHGVGQCPYCKKFVARYACRCKSCGARLGRCRPCRARRRRRGRGVRGGQLVSERELRQMMVG